MGVVIPFPGRSRAAGTSGIRITHIAGRWCIERLADGVITGRTRMPTRADAQRVVVRISRRDRAALLPMHACGPVAERPCPDGAA